METRHSLSAHLGFNISEFSPPGRIRSQVDGNKRVDSVEPRSDFPDASVDQIEGGLLLGHQAWWQREFITPGETCLPSTRAALQRKPLDDSALANSLFHLWRKPAGRWLKWSSQPG
jgi:hypothetical protein